jgi:hypothetical protein
MIGGIAGRNARVFLRRHWLEGRKSALIALLAIAVVADVVWIGTSFNKPLRCEDTIWAFTVHGIFLHGYPLIEYGSTVGRHIAVWHPPIMDYLIAASQFMLGPHAWSFRLPGAIGFMVTVLAGWTFIMRYCRTAGPLFILLVTCAVPLVQGTLIPENDGMLLAPLVAVWALIQVRGIVDPPKFNWIGSSVVWSLLLWTKWTTPPLLLLAWLASLAIYHGWKEFLRQGLLTIVPGTMLFALTYLGWSAWFGLNPIYAFEFSANRHVFSLPMKAHIMSLMQTATLYGVGYLALGAMAFIERPSGWKGRITAFLCLEALAISLGHSIIAPMTVWHPTSWKYHAPAFALLSMAICMSVSVRRLMAAVPPWRGTFVAVAGLVLAVVALREHGWGMEKWAVASGGTVLLGYLVGPGRKGRRTGKWLVWCLLAGAWSQGISHVLTFTNLSPDNSPSFPTGERGFADIVGRHSSDLRAARVLARKDVLYHVCPDNGLMIDPHFRTPAEGLVVPMEKRPLARIVAGHWPFVVKDWNFYPVMEQAFTDRPGDLALLMHERVEVIIDSRADSFLRDPSIRRALLADFRQVDQAGDYVVYSRRKSASSVRR